MALWDSGKWDTAKWSTIEATLAITLDSISVTAAGQDVHAGQLAVTLGDISVSSTGVVTRNGTLAVTLDDVVPALSGNITRHATVAVQLDSIDVVMAGQDVHAGPVAITLDDITVVSSGAITRHATVDITLEDIQVSVTGTTQHNDDFSVQLEDIRVYMEGIAGEGGARRGGFEVKKRKTPVKKNEQAEIEAKVQKAINKVFGIEEPSEEPIEVAETELAPVDYTDQIRAMMLDAHIAALGRQVDEYERAIISAEIAAELDDEEAILFLI